MTRTQPVLAPATAVPAAPAQAGQAAQAGPALTGTPTADVMPPGGFTQAYVNALKQKRTELSNQLSSAQGRRDEVANALEDAPPGAVRTGLEQRLQVLDGRLAQLELDIAANGRQLAAAPGNLLGATTSGRGIPRDNNGSPFSSGQLTAISIVFTLFVMAPMAFAAARRMLRRPFESRPAPQILESAARLERMEQAVDAIAVEVERISEGQRFVTSLMAKRESPALQQAYANANANANQQGGAEPLRAAEPLQASGQGSR